MPAFVLHDPTVVNDLVTMLTAISECVLVFLFVWGLGGWEEVPPRVGLVSVCTPTGTDYTNPMKGSVLEATQHNIDCIK